MKTLIAYYSYTGHTKKIAESLAKKESADIVEIKGESRPGVIRAYTAGCYAALRGLSWPIKPLGADMSKYDNLILMAPVWANNPPPFFNAALESLPAGKTVSVKMVAASGKSKCRKRLQAAIKAKGSELVSFEDIKG